MSFSEVEARHAAELFGLRLPERDIASIVAESGGWPVAVTLALHSLARHGAPRPSLPAKVVTRSVADYIRSELLEPLEPEARSWLLRSSVLDEMSGSLCDDSLQVTRSLAQLRSFERSSLLVQPVDDEATRYRYHPLLRELLLDELEVASPGEARAIAARAARWYDERGESLEALEYGRRAGDRELVANLMARHIWPLHWSGQIATLEHWVDWFDQDGIRERFPAVAVLAGFIFTIDGRRHSAELWLAAAENPTDPRPMPDGSSREAWVAMLRGMMVVNGVDGLEVDARVAEDGMRGDSPFLPGVRVLSALASMLAGRVEEAYERAREAMELADSRGAMPGLAMAAGIAGVLALRAGQPRAARRLIEDTLVKLRNSGLEDYVLASLVHAVAARCAMASGSASQARDHLARVHRLRPLLTASAPWLSVAVRLEAIEALVVLRDIASARTLLREVDDILRIRPSLGLLAEDAAAMRVRLAGIDEPGVGQWTLTGAELRVLQYLPTHLTFGEIAERLHVSPHTVKSQAVAIYSKLGVSSRRAAIEAAVRYGLLDGSALRFPLGPGVDWGVG